MILNAWHESDRILIAVGQMPREQALIDVLKKISEEFGVPVVGEITSNLPTNDLFITHSDTFLAGISPADAENAYAPICSLPLAIRSSPET